MSRTAFLPYLDLGGSEDGSDQGPVAAGVWFRGDLGLAGDRVKVRGWDYSAPLRLSRDLTIDVDATRAALELEADAVLRVVVHWSNSVGLPNGGGLFVREVPLSAGGGHAVRIDVTVPSEEQTGACDLVTSIVLVRAGANPGALSPRLPGSTLWTDQFRLVLEGSAARLPIALVDFAKRFPGEPRAAWSLVTSSDWLRMHVSVGVQMLVNSNRNELVNAVRGGGRGDTGRLIRNVLFHEVGRALLSRALADEEFRDLGVEYPKESIGYSLRKRLRVLFNGRSSEDVAAMMTTSPEEFDRVLQMAQGYLEHE